MQDWPIWWYYEVVLSPHLVERMDERGFSEVELRAMLDDAEGYCASIAPGRFLITTSHHHKPWEVVVEPDEVEGTLIVVTAYPVE